MTAENLWSLQKVPNDIIHLGYRVAASVQKIQFELSMFISLLETIKNMSNYNLLIKADLRLIHKYGTKAS